MEKCQPSAAQAAPVKVANISSTHDQEQELTRLKFEKPRVPTLGFFICYVELFAMHASSSSRCSGLHRKESKSFLCFDGLFCRQFVGKK